MDTRTYSRLLIQLLLLPLLGLSLLAVGLAYSLQRLQKTAAWVDRADETIAGANRLMKLIVDEETGIRGYALTRDPAFLEPYTLAERTLPQQFQTLFSAVRGNAEQTARLQRLNQIHQQWDEEARQEIQSSSVNPSANMLLRKQSMDKIRDQGEDFIHAEEILRKQRFRTSNALHSSTQIGLLTLLVLVGIAILWGTLRTFMRLRQMFKVQLDEATAQHDLAEAGQLWLNTTMRSIGDGVIACDAEGCVVLMNPVAEQLTGWKEQEAKGHPLPDVFHIVTEYTRTMVENPVEKVRRTGTIVGLANHTILIRKDGSECGIDDSGAPIRGADGQMIGIVLVFRDCTARRNSQIALMRAEKLAAAGKLAASIAHEVNNPLEGLTNLIYLARDSTHLGEIQPWLEQAQSEVNRLSHITRQTLGFYRENTQPTDYCPSDVLEEVLAFYVPEALSKQVKLEAQICTQQKTYGVPGELRQVLCNLISNSLDAMPNGGTIRLVARQVTDHVDGAKTGVRITVADTGSGIPREILNRIFEPFFTTKVETGTGLGLWVSKELIEKQGGRLRVRSRNAGAFTGTAFAVFVPVRLQNGLGSGADRTDWTRLPS